LKLLAIFRDGTYCNGDGPAVQSTATTALFLVPRPLDFAVPPVTVPRMAGDASETDRLLREAADGDRESWGRLLELYRERLRRMVALRLDPRLQGRIDPSDVIQEAYLEASARLADYRRQPDMPFYLWLRFLAGQKLVTLHRHHLGTQRRDAAREVSLHHGRMPETSSAALAAVLVGHGPRPSEAAARAELKLRLEEALNSMDGIDREVLTLRHFEHLSRAETAQVLGIQESAVSKRYVRALKRLKDILSGLPGGLEGLLP
jgi:RNA polymerase sigma-70 factor, ECF subfamily